MNQLSKIWSLTAKDLLESLRNKTILIVLLLPLFASLLFAVLSGMEGGREFNIGIIEKDSELINFVENNTSNLQVQKIKNLEAGQNILKHGKIDSLIVRQAPKQFKTYINSQRSITYFALKDNLEVLLNKFLRIEPGLDIEFIPVNTSRASAALLPTWITISIAMIGILILSGNLAEEKENGTLDAVMISPVSGFSILIAKGLFGILLGFITTVVMLIINNALPGLAELLPLLLLIICGTAVFSFLGLLIGILVETQSAARSLGTIIYFPMIFPAFIYDLSAFTRKIAHFFPSFYLFRGLEKILLFEAAAAAADKEIIILSLFSVILIIIEYFIYQRMMGHEFI